MKDTIIKSFTLLVGFALVTYIGWLLVNNAVVTEIEGPTNLLILLLCAGVALYLVAMNFFSARVPNNRRGLAVAGCVILIIADTILIDNPAQQIYLADIMKLVSVFLIIAGPTKMFITKKIQSQNEAKNVQIIEV